MANYLDSIYTALNNLRNIVADYIQAEDIIVATLTVTDQIFFPSVFTWNNLINQLPTLLGTNQLVKTNFTGNITQTGGTNQLLDTEIGSITQGGSSVIVQTGEQWNYLKQTQVTDLELLGHLTLPPDITIAGSSYTDDLVLNNATIQQTTTAGQINTLCATDFYNGDVRLSDNLTMIGGAGTYATLSNLIVNGTSALGLITGTTITDIYNLIASKQNTITSSNRLNADLIGTGIVSNTELNYLDGVTSAKQTQLNGKQGTISSTNRINADLVGTGIVSNTEFNYLDGVTSAIQTQINSKVNATSGTLTNGTADRLCIKNLAGQAISFQSGTMALLTSNKSNGGGELNIITSATNYPWGICCTWETTNTGGNL